MAEIEEIRKKLVKFEEKRAKTKNYNPSIELYTLHLMEEVGELAEQLFSKKVRPERFNENVLKEEVCDVILVALGISNLLNIDLSKELNKKLDELEKRKL